MQIEPMDRRDPTVWVSREVQVEAALNVRGAAPIEGIKKTDQGSDLSC